MVIARSGVSFIVTLECPLRVGVSYGGPEKISQRRGQLKRSG